ncbi:hypothetical protein [Labilithrix luteola]|uniref:hypothetical protein n=1 Tax=Labilithrix luteola TaxID=1391654 RepID=UPI0011BA9941|nr:hypothetical protein [Labilithrix luteola]
MRPRLPRRHRSVRRHRGAAPSVDAQGLRAAVTYASRPSRHPADESRPWGAVHPVESTPAGPPPLSYQVYSPEELDVRRRAPTRLAVGELASKPSLALRVCMVLLGVCVVFGTAALVIAGTSDDPPSLRTTTSSLPPGFPPAPALTSAVTALANVPLVAPAAPADSVAIELGAEPAAPAVKAKPSPRATTSVPSSKTVAPPPNPYEGAPPSAKPSASKK